MTFNNAPKQCWANQVLRQSPRKALNRLTNIYIKFNITVSCFIHTNRNMKNYQKSYQSSEQFYQSPHLLARYLGGQLVLLCFPSTLRWSIGAQRHHHPRNVQSWQLHVHPWSKVGRNTCPTTCNTCRVLFFNSFTKSRPITLSMLKVDGWKYPGAQVHALINISLKFQVCSTIGFRVTRDTNWNFHIFTKSRPITLKPDGWKYLGAQVHTLNNISLK